MDFRKHFETAWSLTLKFVIPLVLMTLVLFVVSAVTLGILSPAAMAGYVHSILLMVRSGREPKIQDIFSQMRLFFPLLLFAIALFIATTLGYLLFVIPGIVIVGLICFGCLYMIPLMTDRKLGLVSAFKESWRLSLEGRIIDQIVVAVLFLGITFVGSSLFIASLFTQPLATAIVLSVYEEKISVSGEKSG
ncbi:MAG: hypothetical protein CVU64_01990 [Deltaproteobacteria bacterium HGW-Deltaproteobacteria-21]|nr:MAG: hypothetical protein CVU64_01990 [Deltaproteobacteria bacterium HGW-Deltaproteobacteria-21]